MLKYPNSTVDFQVTPAYFVGAFDVYDRDDLEEYLNNFDPENIDHLEVLLKERVFSGKEAESLTREHKAVLIKVLRDALTGKDDKFDQFLLDSHDDCFYLPSEWDIKDPRGFFEKVYKIVLEEWKDSL